MGLKELFLHPFLAHDVLEVLGKVIDHCVPDPFIHVSSSSPDVSVQLGQDFLYPKMHLWASEVSVEQHGLLHGVIDDPGVFVYSSVDASAGHEFFDFVLISFKDLRLFSYHLI